MNHTNSKQDDKNRELNVTYVARDQIWKDYVKNCNYAAKKWPENWGFLTSHSIEYNNNTIPSKRKVKQENYVLADDLFVKSPRPVPITSAGVIGWRSTESSCKLDKYGYHGRARTSIEKTLKWPNEAL
jgi:hypothetical protein